jgi:hypothetical protein
VIRVTIEVDIYGHRYTFSREDVVLSKSPEGTPACDTIDKLLADVRGAARAALKAHPDRLPE